MHYDPERKQIEFDPSEYKTEPIPGQPIFGPGWPIAVAVVVGILATATAVHYMEAGLLSRIIGPILGVVAYGVAGIIATTIQDSRSP